MAQTRTRLLFSVIILLSTCACVTRATTPFAQYAAAPPACAAAMVADISAGVAGGEDSTMLSQHTCEVCDAEQYCAIGINNNTGALVGWRTPPALECRGGSMRGITRTDADGHTITFCFERPRTPVGVIVAPILLFVATLVLPLVLCCRKCCAPKKRIVTVIGMDGKPVAEPEEPDTTLGWCTRKVDAPKERSIALPADRLVDLSIEDQRRYAYEIEKGMASYTLPYFTAPPRDTGKLLGFLPYLWSVVLRSARTGWELLTWACAQQQCHGVFTQDAMAVVTDREVVSLWRDFWFFMKQHHMLLSIALLHPLTLTRRPVRAVTLTTELFFSYFVNWEFGVVFGVKDSKCSASSGCDSQIQRASVQYGHSVAAVSASAITLVAICSALLNYPYTFFGDTMCMQCSAFFCCHDRSKCKKHLRALGFYLWCMCGIPMSVTLFIYGASVVAATGWARAQGIGGIAACVAHSVCFILVCYLVLKGSHAAPATHCSGQRHGHAWYDGGWLRHLHAAFLLRNEQFDALPCFPQRVRA
jgi:hypothetical protein